MFKSPDFQPITPAVAASLVGEGLRIWIGNSPVIYWPIDKILECYTEDGALCRVPVENLNAEACIALFRKRAGIEMGRVAPDLESHESARLFRNFRL